MLKDKYVEALQSFIIYDKEFLPDLYARNQNKFKLLVNMLAAQRSFITITTNNKEMIEFLDGNGFILEPTKDKTVVKLIPQYMRTVHIDGRKYQITIDTSNFPDLYE